MSGISRLEPNIKCGNTPFLFPRFPPDSELTELFDFHLGRLMERGVMDKIRKKYVPDIKRDLSDSGNDDNDDELAIALGYDNVLFPFLLLLSGILVGGGMSILERVYVYAVKKCREFRLRV